MSQRRDHLGQLADAGVDSFVVRPPGDSLKPTASPRSRSNLVDYMIRHKQVLAGLTREYYIAALPASVATGKRGSRPPGKAERR